MARGLTKIWRRANPLKKNQLQRLRRYKNSPERAEKLRVLKETMGLEREARIEAEKGKVNDFDFYREQYNLAKQGFGNGNIGGQRILHNEAQARQLQRDSALRQVRQAIIGQKIELRNQRAKARRGKPAK